MEDTLCDYVLGIFIRFYLFGLSITLGSLATLSALGIYVNEAKNVEECTLDYCSALILYGGIYSISSILLNGALICVCGLLYLIPALMLRPITPGIGSVLLLMLIIGCSILMGLDMEPLVRIYFSTFWPGA